VEQTEESTLEEGEKRESEVRQGVGEKGSVGAPRLGRARWVMMWRLEAMAWRLKMIVRRSLEAPIRTWRGIEGRMLQMTVVVEVVEVQGVWMLVEGRRGGRAMGGREERRSCGRTLRIGEMQMQCALKRRN
jgi:hypothetical protein